MPEQPMACGFTHMAYTLGMNCITYSLLGALHADMYMIQPKSPQHTNVCNTDMPPLCNIDKVCYTNWIATAKRDLRQPTTT
jgi:hypothetical protein